MRESGDDAHEDLLWNRIHAVRTTFVRISADTVIKCGYGDFEMELEKARLLHEISARHSFVSPRVLNASRTDSSICFERVRGLTHIRHQYLDACQGRTAIEPVVELFARAGDALARIHADLRLSQCIDWCPSPAFESDLLLEGGLDDVGIREVRAPVVLHGDYGFANVFVVSEPTMQIAVLDASPNGFTTFLPNERGPRYIDVANMVACIQGLVPLSSYPSIDWSIAGRLAHSFLAGYESAAKCRLSRKYVFAWARATARTYLRYRCKSRLQRSLALKTFFWSRKKALLYHD